jgi:hypothetical protein
MMDLAPIRSIVIRYFAIVKVWEAPIDNEGLDYFLEAYSRAVDESATG